MKSFVEFYESEKISPVSQDITDLEAHFRRRDALYRALGIVPSYIKGRSVIEFGPGSGYNSIHTAKYGPGRYLMVDGNRYGVEKIRALFDEHRIAEDYEIERSLIEEFQTEERFDLVLCEGTLPFQAKPEELLVRVAEHTVTGGVVVVTCVDPIGYLPEALRRFAAKLYVRDTVNTDEQLERLEPLLAGHLSTMKAMSRPHRDWLLDNIVQPFSGRRLLSFAQVVETLGGEFSVHGSSPRFISDWRWYKAIIGDPREEYNRVALEEYWKNAHGFLDYRFTEAAGDPEQNREIETLSNEVYELCLAIESDRADLESLASRVDAVVGEILNHLRHSNAVTRLAFEDFRKALPQCLDQKPGVSWGEFAGLFGRGQQYVSLIREKTEG